MEAGIEMYHDEYRHAEENQLGFLQHDDTRHDTFDPHLLFAELFSSLKKKDLQK